MRRSVIALVLTVVMAGAALAADGMVPNRMARAAVGEWVLLMDTAGPTAGEKEKFTVSEIRGEEADREVVITRERYSPEGELLETKTIEINLERYAERMAELEDKAVRISRERAVVEDEELTVWSLTWEREEEGETHEYMVWLSDQIPVGGFFKSWSSNPAFSAAELIDSGS